MRVQRRSARTPVAAPLVARQLRRNLRAESRRSARVGQHVAACTASATDAHLQLPRGGVVARTTEKVGEDGGTGADQDRGEPSAKRAKPTVRVCLRVEELPCTPAPALTPRRTLCASPKTTQPQAPPVQAQPPPTFAGASTRPSSDDNVRSLLQGGPSVESDPVRR